MVNRLLLVFSIPLAFSTIPLAFSSIPPGLSSVPPAFSTNGPTAGAAIRVPGPICIPGIPGSVGGAGTINVLEPIIPNKVADRYVPARNEAIEGVLGYRLNVNLEKRLLRIDSAILLSGFEKRPGSQTWIGEHVGKFLFSASQTYRYNQDPRIKQLMDAMVRTYLSCQLPDGYLGTYLLKDRWTEWDVWAHKYAIIGLLNYYSVTGYTPALDGAKKAADLICATFGDEPGKRDLMPAGFHEGLAPGSILEPMVDLYRYTGDPKYLHFCEYILRAFEQPDGPKIISTIEKYGNVTKVGDAKAYEMMSCFLGILKYYRLTGDTRYLKALETAWEDIRSKRMYITGTASDHEIFRGDHVLRAENKDDMGEGCVTVTWIQFNLQLLQITGDRKYSEELERSVYNHLFAAENPQTGCVSYYTALQGAKPYKCDQGYSCCLSSVPRGISLIPSMVWGKIDHVFSVLLYEAGTVTDTITTADHQSITLHLESASDFPASGKLTYTVVPSVSGDFPLNFRVPEWSENFTAGVGTETYHGEKGALLRISRNWKPGDKIVVSFGIPVKILPGGLSYPGKIAFKRGPQVLAVDAALNPGLDSLASLRGIVYTGSKISEKGSWSPVLLPDASDKVPADWGWKQAYAVTCLIHDKPREIVLVPFAEAGQKATPLEVWIRSAAR